MAEKSNRGGARRSREEQVRPRKVVKSATLKKVTKRWESHREEVFAAAEYLCERGIPCIATDAVRAGEKGSGKRPANGLSFKDATTEPKTFRKQAAGVKKPGIAIPTGKGLVVVDVDVPGGNRTLRRLERKLGKLPKTVTAKTGSGGRHRIFLSPTKLLKTKRLKKVDLLAIGAMAKMPPSEHANGRYKWLRGMSPWERDFAEIPEAWVDFWQSEEVSKKVASKGIVRLGERNNHLTERAGVLAANGLRGDELLGRLLKVNKRELKEPLAKAEVRKIALSIDRRASDDDLDPVVRAKQETLRRFFENGDHLICAKDHRFYWYNGQLWELIDEDRLKKKILNAAADAPRKGKPTQLARDVVELLRIDCSRSGDPLHFDTPPPAIINLANGELHLSPNGRHELKRHDPKSGLRHVIDFDYDPDAECPEFDRALREIFSQAHQPQKVIDFILELFGYVLQPKRDQALFVIAYGRGANGKTKLFNLLVRLLGRHLVFFGQIQDLDGSRFAIGHLLGKLLFMDDDVKTNIKLSDGLLKKLSEAKMMTGEVKFGPSFEFECRALPILLTNNFPTVNDVSDGFMRRLYVVHFGRQFLGKDQDPELFDRIARNEMSGVLNRALAGWVRLVKNGQFTVGKDMRRARREMLRQANPLRGFIDEHWVPDEGASMPLVEFYAQFRHWTQTNGYSLTQSQPIVRRNLEHMGFRVPRRAAGRTLIGLRRR